MAMKEMLCREGRDAKNLLVYQFCGETIRNEESGKEVDGYGLVHVNCNLIQSSATANRKPSAAPTKSLNPMLTTLPPTSQTTQKCQSPTSRQVVTRGKQCSGPRVRSASTGRDKKSELQARYWALLFGNLQRSVNEIYQTVECYENISSCQEAILVLENYVRDFKALSEWFKVSWDYESRPLQQRPQSLAWEVRKSNPVPRVRAKSLSSPTASGKSSPALYICNSGKTSPCYGSAGANDGQFSPRKTMRAFDQLPKSAMRVNVRELFASDRRLLHEKIELNHDLLKMSEEATSIGVDGKNHQYAQTDLEDDHLTLADIREKLKREAEESNHTKVVDQFQIIQNEENPLELNKKQAEKLQQMENEIQPTYMETKQTEENSNVELADSTPKVTDLDTKKNSDDLDEVANNIVLPMSAEPTAVELTVKQLNDMENALLVEQARKSPTSHTAIIKTTSCNGTKKIQNMTPPQVLTVINNTSNSSSSTTVTSQLSINNAAHISPLKYSSVLNRPPIVRTSSQKTIAQSSTVQKSFNKSAVKKSAPIVNTNLRRSTNNSSLNNRTVMTRGRNTAAVQPTPLRPSSKTECYGPPTNVATRLSARSRTMLEINANINLANTTKSLPQKRNNQFLVASNASVRLGKPLGASNGTSRKSSHEDVGSSTSTLKASAEHIATSRGSLSKPFDERHSEPKQLPSDINDGWLTVKNRRRSSMHWSNRFNQPTGYASLPTLTLLNEQQQQHEESLLSNEGGTKKPNGLILTQNTTTAKIPAENQIQLNRAPKLTCDKTAKQTVTIMRPEIKNAKAKVNSLPTQRKNTLTSPNPFGKQIGIEKSHSSMMLGPIASRHLIIKRQKSDLTGLKMTALHKEYMRSEKNAQRKQQQQLLQNEFKDHAINISSSVETVVETNYNSSTSREQLNLETGGEQNKIDIKIQTNREFSKTIGELYESISRTAKVDLLCVSISSKQGITTLSSCDETDENVLVNGEDGDEEHNERMLVEEQEQLERQIRELESTEIDVDTETDETDCEVVLELEDGDDALAAEQVLDDTSAVVFVTVNDDENVSLEMRYQALLSDMSWVEREEALATLQAYVARHPGRAQELHQKLSSPSRRRSLQETLKKYQAKQARAQQKREFLQKEKGIKIQQLLTRVEDVKAAKRQLIEDKRLKMEERLQRATENREQYLRQIVEKAHDEEKKLKEINFIKNIEAQNKRLDLIESSKDAEGRLQDLEQERQKRLEEKAAKEAAVERRRQELEKERQRKLEKMNESRLEKEQRIGKMQEQKERQRQALAREKARDREERLLALQAQQQQTTEELQRKIQQKQLESARRHEENIEHIRQRALELTIPTRNVDEQREENHQNPSFPCSISGGTFATEDGELSSTVSDVGSREHSRSYKKKMKKLKQRMLQIAEDYLKDMSTLPLHVKRESQVAKFLNLITKGGGAQGLDRALGNLLRLLPKAQVYDFQSFLYLDGLGIITRYVIGKGMEEDSEVSKKSVILAVQLYRNSCSVCPQIARHAILGNSLAVLFDAIFQSLQIPEEKSPQHPVELSTELMLACTVAMTPSYTKKHTHLKVMERLPDLISYAVITGLIEILSRRCVKIRESVETHQGVVLSLLATLGFLTRFIDVCPPGPTDTTRFLSAAKSTELFGTVSMLYGSVVPIGECIPPRTLSLAASTFNLFVSLAALDINTFQDIASNEALSVKLLDVITILLNYCCNKNATAKNSESNPLTIDLVATIGFFCVNNRKNQDLLTSEQCSIIIKSIAKLPEHFNPVVYPCLVTMTFQNESARNVISRDFNIEFLDEYSKSERGKKNQLVALIKE